MSTKIQQKLWKLANYDSFLMEYCPVLHNKIAGIGIFFLFWGGVFPHHWPHANNQGSEVVSHSVQDEIAARLAH